MSDFERSGMTYDEPVKRRSPGTWFAELGERLRGYNNLDRATDDEPDWEEYDELEEATAPVEPVDWRPSRPGPTSSRKRFPTALHGYDREAVDAHLAALERELVELRVERTAVPAVQDELERLGEETSAILKVAHEQAGEITRRAQVQADRCVADAAANAVAMTEDAKRKLRQLDSETDAVWAERSRLIEDVRNVATALFSLAEDAADRFPDDGDKRGPATTPATSAAGAPATAPPPQRPAAQAPVHLPGPPTAPAAAPAQSEDLPAG